MIILLRVLCIVFFLVQCKTQSSSEAQTKPSAEKNISENNNTNDLGSSVKDLGNALGSSPEDIQNTIDKLNALPTDTPPAITGDNNAETNTQAVKDQQVTSDFVNSEVTSINNTLANNQTVIQTGQGEFDPTKNQPATETTQAKPTQNSDTISVSQICNAITTLGCSLLIGAGIYSVWKVKSKLLYPLAWLLFKSNGIKNAVKGMVMPQTTKDKIGYIQTYDRPLTKDLLTTLSTENINAYKQNYGGIDKKTTKEITDANARQVSKVLDTMISLPNTQEKIRFFNTEGTGNEEFVLKKLPKAGTKLVLFFPGNGWDSATGSHQIQTFLKRILPNTDYHTIGMNWPKNPENKEQIYEYFDTLVKLIVDLKVCKPEDLILVGHSLGGAMATHVASEMWKTGNGPTLITHKSFSNVSGTLTLFNRSRGSQFQKPFLSEAGVDFRPEDEIVNTPEEKQYHIYGNPEEDGVIGYANTENYKNQFSKGFQNHIIPQGGVHGLTPMENPEDVEHVKIIEDDFAREAKQVQAGAAIGDRRFPHAVNLTESASKLPTKLAHAGIGIALLTGLSYAALKTTGIGLADTTQSASCMYSIQSEGVEMQWCLLYKSLNANSMAQAQQQCNYLTTQEDSTAQWMMDKTCPSQAKSCGGNASGTTLFAVNQTAQDFMKQELCP